MVYFVFKFYLETKSEFLYIITESFSIVENQVECTNQAALAELEAFWYDNLNGKLVWKDLLNVENESL